MYVALGIFLYYWVEAIALLDQVYPIQRTFFSSVRLL
jgi:hypothetical protein